MPALRLASTTAPAACAPASGAPRRRGRPRSGASSAAALRAAYRLVAEHGLKAATIDAIAAESGVSKMTIYKWWGGRLPLLIDAFLERSNLMFPLVAGDAPVAALQAHAARYVGALHGEFGRVLRAVLAECMVVTGDARLLFERYLSARRRVGVDVIRAAQRNGQASARLPAQALYDQIYGTLFYRFVFGIPGLDARFARRLVASTLRDGREPR